MSAVLGCLSRVGERGDKFSHAGMSGYTLLFFPSQNESCMRYKVISSGKCARSCLALSHVHACGGIPSYRLPWVRKRSMPKFLNSPVFSQRRTSFDVSSFVKPHSRADNAQCHERLLKKKEKKQQMAKVRPKMGLSGISGLME